MLVLILQVYRKMKARQHDVKKAFTIPLNHSEPYMEAPMGMQLPPGHVLLLVHNLNGTKQAAYDWFVLICEFFISLGFKSSVLEPCLFYRWRGDTLTIVALYVDDIRVLSDTDEDLDEIEQQVRARRFPIETYSGS
jgi:hypothetical protein